MLTNDSCAIRGELKRRCRRNPKLMTQRLSQGIILITTDDPNWPAADIGDMIINMLFRSSKRLSTERSRHLHFSV